MGAASVFIQVAERTAAKLKFESYKGIRTDRHKVVPILKHRHRHV
jgi:hypothetical protein